jgi:hypothetical protein
MTFNQVWLGFRNEFRTVKTDLPLLVAVADRHGWPCLGLFGFSCLGRRLMSGPATIGLKSFGVAGCPATTQELRAVEL